MRHYTAEEIRRAGEEYDHRQQINEWMMCYADFRTESGGVRWNECPRGLKSCDGCEVKDSWDLIELGYLKDIRKECPNSEHAISEAHWMTHQWYDIPTVYMCDGNDGGWYKEHRPDIYRKLLDRQRELLDGEGWGTKQDLKDNNQEPKEFKAEIPGQMNIFDFL